MAELKLKRMLMLLSLSPLALLTIIRNFSFEPVREFGTNQNCLLDFFKLNSVLITVDVLCGLWIIAAMISFFCFQVFKWIDFEEGYELSFYEEKEDASLNFFMTMIIPLLIDDVGSIQGAITFCIIVIMMCCLLSKTHLYYANPVLAVLGYHLYEVQFKDNGDFTDKKCWAVVLGRFSKKIGTVRYKKIDDTVLYMEVMKRKDHLSEQRGNTEFD